MQKLDPLAPIIWAKWGNVFLEALRQEAEEAPDRLAFQAMNSAAGVRLVLVVCTVDDQQRQSAEQSLALRPVPLPADWRSYSVAELIFRSEKRGGRSHQATQDSRGRAALVLCATQPESVRTLERLFDLPE